jgi:hypothetical protein
MACCRFGTRKRRHSLPENDINFAGRITHPVFDDSPNGFLYAYVIRLVGQVTHERFRCLIQRSGLVRLRS